MDERRLSVYNVRVRHPHAFAHGPVHSDRLKKKILKQRIGQSSNRTNENGVHYQSVMDFRGQNGVHYLHSSPCLELFAHSYCPF